MMAETVSPLLARMVSDLRLPITESALAQDKVYTSFVLYSALSEWLRIITFDSDPTLGNGKVGVTKAYLIHRGTEALQTLVNTTDRGNELKPHEFELATQWLADAMLKLGELFEPESGIVALPSKVSEKEGGSIHGHTRLLGRRDLMNNTVIQAGFCRYTAEMRDTEESAKQRLDTLTALKEFCADAECEPAIDVDKLAQHLLDDRKRFCIQHSEENKLTYVIAKFNNAFTEEEKTMLLHIGWPMCGVAEWYKEPNAWAVRSELFA